MSSDIARRFKTVGDGSSTLGIVRESDPDAKLEINVIFTDKEGTLAALKTAGVLAHHLGARIKLVVFQVVPMAFPLTRPPVSISFLEQRHLDFVNQGVQGRCDTAVNIVLCRDRRQALHKSLNPGSLVLIGGRARWWSRAESRLAKMLRAKGHQVIFVPER